ncbi:MAG: protein translocase subunit SecD [Alphaproteobacteria bacterium]|nr:protein translocase subunit SecD [Alphaproteobacteria bacterium]
MTNIPLWKTILIVAVCLFGILYSLPNVVGTGGRTWLQSNLPGWLPNKTVNLGLDLRGGAHLLYELDIDVVFRERADSLLQDLRTGLRKEKIGYSRIGVVPKGVRLTLRDAGDGETARRVIRGLDKNLVVTNTEGGLTIEALMDDAAQRQITDSALSQSIEIVRRRVDELGTTEPLIQRQGQHRILIQAPGANAEELKKTIGTTAKLSFHMVSEPGEGGAVKMLPFAEDPARKVAVSRRALITGDMLTNAQPAFDQNGQPVISFRLNSPGARRFCDVSRANVNKPFAIVLDSEILSAPVIREPICGGQGQISGNFSVEAVSNLALLLRAGALPAPMSVVEERTVGPTLGADSVEAGKKAGVMALIFVVIFSCTVFGLFGIFASVGLLINMALILAIMSTLQATLTLPGIAGIVLTIGLAVDSNVLVFERIKEELRAGRSIISAIDTGYQRAKTTITDSNLTSLIAALILFSFGTGPIKGFAVTMCVGVVTSYFCAIMLNRLMVLTWLRWAKPKEIKV